MKEGFGITGTAIKATKPVGTVPMATPKVTGKTIRKQLPKKEVRKETTQRKQKPKKKEEKEQKDPPQVEQPIQQKIAQVDQKHQEPVVEDIPESKPEGVQKVEDKRMVMIRYSHYRSKFEAINDFVTWTAIDSQYSISYVFKGNFIPKLKHPTTKQYVDRQDGGWMLSPDAEEYLLEVQEDEEEEAKYEHKPYIAPKEEKSCSFKKKGRDQLTEQLKQLSEEELRAKGEKYRELIEQRDLEDILY